MLMDSKQELEKELTEIRRQLEKLGSSNAKEARFLEKRGTADETSSNLLAMLRFVIDENRRTTSALKGLAETVAQLTDELNGTEESEAQLQGQFDELPVSGLDERILQYIQVKGMACADDIKSIMNYKGRNAACARLTELYKRGALQRYQLGHKVYYKYDAGKATTTLIVSPPH
jgi:sugar-specific transcriptional regulator TrmB